MRDWAFAGGFAFFATLVSALRTNVVRSNPTAAAAQAHFSHKSAGRRIETGFSWTVFAVAERNTAGCLVDIYPV